MIRKPSNPIKPIQLNQSYDIRKYDSITSNKLSRNSSKNILHSQESMKSIQTALNTSQNFNSKNPNQQLKQYFNPKSTI